MRKVSRANLTPCLSTRSVPAAGALASRPTIRVNRSAQPLQFGSIKVHRVEETEGLGFHPAFLLPDVG